MKEFANDNLEKPSLTMLQLIGRLALYARTRAGLLLAALLLSFGTTGVTLYLPHILKSIVDDALIPQDHDLLYWLAGLYFGLELARVCAHFAHTYMFQIVGQRILHDIRSDLYHHLIRMPVRFFNKNPSGKLVTRLTNDTANLAELFSYEFLRIISDGLIVIGVLFAMLYLNVKLGLILVCLFPVIVFIIRFFSDRMRHVFRASREKLSEVNAFFAERMSGMPTVQMMGREAYENERFQRLSDEYYQRQSASVRIFAMMMPSITVLSMFSIALVIFFGGRVAAAGEMQLGTLVAFFFYVQLMYQPVRSMTEKFQMFQKCMASADRIFHLLAETEENELSDEYEPKGLTLAGDIEFRNVSFSYHDQITSESKWALRDCSFKIKAGETIALVGHTGAGKTTLASLLFRFYDHQKGDILVDDRKIEDYDKRALRSNLGYVQQDVFVFSGSLLENIRLLRPNCTEAELQFAIEHSGLKRVIDRLPDGLDTVLDERGANLSQGERQILSFARVLLQQPKILILDEATASMDAESEYKIQQATREAVRGRTAIIIAHRLSTIREADRIFVFSHGRLVEAGSHDQLLAKKGMYEKFVRMQSGMAAAGISAHHQSPSGERLH